jgi:hypothetical protein
MKSLTVGRLVATVAIIALVLSGIAVGWLVYGYETSRVVVNSANWQVFRNGTSEGFVCSGSCLKAPITTAVGALLTLQLGLYGTTSGPGLTVRSVNAPPGFVFVGITPSLPAAVSQGAYSTFNVTVEVPTTAGSYDFMGTVLAAYG